MEPLRERPVAGAEACGEERGPQASEERIMDRISLLLRLRAQTKQQLLEYKSVIDANEEKTPEQIMQEKQIEVILNKSGLSWELGDLQWSSIWC
ncbi:rCG44590, isoform CRA_e [Rattus norvegicus]|uniref:RCG44590, isoform CRA_e n=1 Tax=Rattus norvegicus TaxID=10116 RepID=A6I5B1_RAT|nr:rCG44590, isoform CRA_e [Rattus norvegicus]